MTKDTEQKIGTAEVAPGIDKSVKQVQKNGNGKTAADQTETVPRVTTADDNTVTVAKRPIYKRVGVLAAFAVFLLIVGVFGVRYYLYAGAHESTDDAFVEGDIVQISPKVTGHIVKLYVESNQAVKEGDLLAEIDPRDYQAQVEQAQAVLNSAITKQKESKINVELTSKTSRAGVQQASSSVQLARQGVATSTATVGNFREKAVQAA